MAFVILRHYETFPGGTVSDILSWDNVGDVGFTGLLVVIVIFFTVQWVRGELVSRKQLEQVQKIAETFREAWEVSERSNDVLRESVQGQTEVLNRLLLGQETMVKILKASPAYQESDES